MIKVEESIDAGKLRMKPEVSWMPGRWHMGHCSANAGEGVRMPASG
jgi:hypothetical protein